MDPDLKKRIVSWLFNRVPKDAPRIAELPEYGPSYNEDGLYTNHLCDFLNDKRFLEAYDLCYSTGSSQGWHFRWRVHTLLWASSVCSNIEGDFVECGTYLGGSARAIVNYVDFNKLGKTFYLIDTYEGLPEEHSNLHDYRETDYYERVRALFSEYPGVKLVKGIVPQVLNDHEFGKVSLLSIDLGVPEAEEGALRFFWEKLSKGAIVVLDYYAYPVANVREIKAGYDRFASEVGCEIYHCPTGQGLIIKT